MARLSKSHHFKIYEDTGIPTPPGDDESDPFSETVKSTRISNLLTPSKTARQSHAEVHRAAATDESEDEEDVAPRDSLTSVSSYPESASAHNEPVYAPPVATPQKFFTPQIIRPSFRRPESVQRMQMSSPRQSVLSNNRSSRSGTPRSGVGRGRRRITEELTSEDEPEEEKVDEGREHPLVLLHITILPIQLQWSAESVQELLPQDIIENMLLLKSKVSETVQQRGILIPHPREEYEMLEERLLQALELKDERLTKCGHFRGRLSADSVRSSDQDGDSGIGSVDGDGDICPTCRHSVCCSAGKKQKWEVKVFAANGLMRASAWSAAWDGMESVDVEILPWIREMDRRKLDRRREEDEQERERKRVEAEAEAEARALIESPSTMAYGKDLTHEELFFERGDSWPARGATSGLDATKTTSCQAPPASKESHVADDLPPVYSASQVPLSTLLRNYVFLLAQDRRNMAMLFVAVIAMFLAVRTVSPGQSQSLVSVDHDFVHEIPPLVDRGETSSRTLPTGDYFETLAEAEVTLEAPGVVTEATALTSSPRNDAVEPEEFEPQLGHDQEMKRESERTAEQHE